LFNFFAFRSAFIKQRKDHPSLTHDFITVDIYLAFLLNRIDAGRYYIAPAAYFYLHYAYPAAALARKAFMIAESGDKNTVALGHVKQVFAFFAFTGLSFYVDSHTKHLPVVFTASKRQTSLQPPQEIQASPSMA